jgi:hypothetical protein
MNFVCRWTLTALLLMFGYFAAAQDNRLAQSLNTVQKQASDFPYEKAYLHMDKPRYVAGDTIWFKSYTVIGADHRLSVLSGILNVELINDRNTIVQSIKLALFSGLAYGDFALPDTLLAGRYRVRAWTNWMRNAGTEYFFDEPVFIGNTNTPTVFNRAGYKKPVTEETATPSSTHTDIQFFPEGGYLVNGVASKVAFKATGDGGLGTAVKGVITDEQGNEIAPFSSTYLGMGAFLFAPQNGKTYRAKITYPDGITSNIDLPKAKDSGYVLAVNNSSSENISVKIISVNKVDEVTLVAQSGGYVCYEGKSQPGKAMFLANIPKNKFPSGIVKLTLFSNSGEPLNERLVFVQNPDKLNLSISTPQQIYTPRQKVKVDLDVKDGRGQPMRGSFSAAVINETKVPVDEDSENNILSNLLLTSDLKGYIEKPGYYFANINEKINADLDNLMLTQGYSRFEWKKLSNNEMPPVTYSPEKSLNISGRVMLPDNKPVEHGKVFLYSMSGGALVDTTTDEQGRFLFSDLFFKDSTGMVIKALTAKGRNNVNIQLDNSVPEVTGSNTTALSKYENATPYVKNNGKIVDEGVNRRAGEKNVLLNEVTIKTEKARGLQYSSNLNGPGNADQVIYADNLLLGCPTFRSCMEGRLLGVEFEPVTGNPVSSRSRSSIAANPGATITEGASTDNMSSFQSTSSYQSVAMAIIIDGHFIGQDEEPEALSNLDMTRLSAVEVLRRGDLLSAYGSRGANGIIVITTKHGLDINLDKLEINKTLGQLNYTPKGYYKAHIFYTPKYDNPVSIKVPDPRTTIYWKPDIQTGKDGNVSFEYYNADDKGTYRIVIEGIDYNGNIGRQVYRYKVE